MCPNVFKVPYTTVTLAHFVSPLKSPPFSCEVQRQTWKLFSPKVVSYGLELAHSLP